MPLCVSLSSKRSRPGVGKHPEDVEMSQTIGVGGSFYVWATPPAYESAEYKKAMAALGSGVESDFRIAEGV
jgi:hypothetical protein